MPHLATITPPQCAQPLAASPKRSKLIFTDAASDYDSHLYQTARGSFFLERIECLLDGKPLPPWKHVKDAAPELDPITRHAWEAEAMRERQRRISYRHPMLPVSILTLYLRTGASGRT